MGIIAGLIFCMVVILGLALHFKRPIVWLIGTLPSALMAAYGYTASVVTWDMYYLSFWMGVAMLIVFVLMTLQTRNLDAEESEEEPPKSDMATYKDETGPYKEGQKEMSEATARRRKRR